MAEITLKKSDEMDNTHQKIVMAMEFANEAHRAHMYSSTQPYVKHLENVYNVLLRYGCKSSDPDQLEILIAAWLHDCLEDTATSYSDVKKVFGESVAEIVFCLTDELGRNRKEKKEKTYPKIRSNWKSIIVKVADRIANIEHSLNNTKEKSFSQMYKKEYNNFRHELCTHPECSITLNDEVLRKCNDILIQLWNKLDQLNDVNHKQVIFKTPSNRKLIATMPMYCKNEIEITESIFDQVIKKIESSGITSIGSKL